MTIAPPVPFVMSESIKISMLHQGLREAPPGTISLEPGPPRDGGAYRSETRGYVRFAPNVGPVESFEQFIPSVEGVACGPWQVGEQVSLVTMKLSSLPVPARPTSWGKLKVAYR